MALTPRPWSPSGPADGHPGGGSTSTLEDVLAEFTGRWERGETPPAEEYLDRLAPDQFPHAVELIYQEYCLAESSGLAPDPSAYLERFPAQRDSLRRLFLLENVFERAWDEPARLPQVGDEIGPYRLLREMGRGSFGRVFLAEQADLGHRLVVVKVSTRLSPEPRLLARARHTYIVEILWHGTADDGALQLISMPFLGGATLATVLAEWTRRGRRPASGRGLLGVLDRVAAPEYPSSTADRPAREILRGLSYTGAVAWIVARLAEALHHAYSRGVVHGDLKPSNVLLTADGVPMLLDFNLASGRDFADADDLAGDPGGTVAYMAPERLRAIADGGTGPAPSPADRHRADLYALGIILLEALSGRPPEVPEGRGLAPREFAALVAARRPGKETMIRSSSFAIPAALRSILARCLAPDPADRYRDASELAEDLDRWRVDRPLAFAREPHWGSSLLRWGRRQRVAVTAALLSAAICAATTLAVWEAFRTSIRVQSEGKLSRVWDDAGTGAFHFHRIGHWRSEDQGDPAETALHHLRLYGVTEPGDWRRRDDVAALSPSEAGELEVWLLEQGLRYGHALAERPDSPDDWRRGLTVLGRVQGAVAFGPLETQARLLRRHLRLPEPPPQSVSPADLRLPPRWMEDYLLGVEAELGRDAEAARVHYQHALAANPASFWGKQRAAVVAYRLGDPRSAADLLGRCIAQRPRNAMLHGQLAGCLYQLRRDDAALEECNKAVELDPDLTEFYRTRTFVRGRLGQVEDLRADLDRFELLTRRQGKGPSLRLRLDTMLTLGLDTVRTGPEGDLPRRLLAVDPEDVDLRSMLAMQFWEGNHLDLALAEFDKILESNPDHLRALYARATLLRKLGRGEADRDFATLLEHPRLEELLGELGPSIRIFHIVSRAYLQEGRVRDALRIAERGLEQSNRIKVMRGESHYALARVYSAARTDPEHMQKAIEHLKIARSFKVKFTDQWLERDVIFRDSVADIRHLLRSSRP